jgi:hypothetical protein
MAVVIPIWEGSSSFSPGQTPFGFYDDDPIFVSDADKVAKWCATRLGYPLVNVELQSGSFYSALEEATLTYTNHIYQYKIQDNYSGLEGSNISSLNSNGGIANSLVVPTPGAFIRIAKSYGAEAGTGGNVTWYSGSINMTSGIQDYDLDQWAKDNGISGSIEIKRIFYEGTPAIARYFDPYAGSGMGTMNMLDEFGFGASSPAISFMLMPINADILRTQAIEFNDQIRKSAYSFELINNKLRIFPVPLANTALYFQYILIEDRDNTIYNFDKATGIGEGATMESGSFTSNSVITNPFQVPTGPTNQTYSSINSVGRAWIYKYALALSKEMLGLVRKKYQSIPIPGAEVQLNGDDLLSSSKDDKEQLVTTLLNQLEQMSRANQYDKRNAELNAMRDVLNNVPLPIYIK